jgi:hypothetical protein
MQNTIYASQTDIQRINEQIMQEEANAAIAKDRVSYIRNPEENTSNYESWFPIDRPIHIVSLIILMSISIFIGTFLLLMISSVLGFDINMYIKTSSSSLNRGSVYYMIYSQFTPLATVSLVILISVILYFVYR